MLSLNEGAVTMSYAVVHMQKLKGQAIKGIQFHNQRERDSQTNKEIDEERSHLNYDLVNPEPVDYNQKINQMIQEQVETNRAIRKDAVKVAGFLVTSDKEFFDKISPEQEKEFFEKSLEFFKEKYGEEKIAYATVHKDEKTPHMHVGFVPITEDNRLSAKDFFGRKSQLHQLQDEFHKHVKENGFDLERGVSSDRKHIEMNKYKAMTQEKELEKLEGKLEQIKPINAEIEKIDEIKGKTAFNTTVLSKADYEFLKDTAKENVKLRYDLSNTQQELEVVKDEYKDFKHGVSESQQEVREHAKKTVQEAQRDVQEVKQENDTLKQENKHIKANMNDLATEKAKEMRTGLDQSKIYDARLQGEKVAEEKYVKAFEPKWNEKIAENKGLKAENKELKSSLRNLSIDKEELKVDIKSLDNALTEEREINRTLKHDNSLLQDSVQKLSYQLQHLTKYMDKFKDKVMTKVSSWIAIKVPYELKYEVGKEFDEAKKGIVESAEQNIEKDLQKELNPELEHELGE